MLACGVLASAASGQAVRGPHLGYVFPAGAKCGATVEVLVGGQNLRGVTQVVVSGDGVSARVLKFFRPVRNFDKEQRDEVQRRIAARRAVLAGLPEPPVPPRAKDAPPLEMPEHVMLDRIPYADAAELGHLVQVYLRGNRMQPNPQLAEMVTLDVVVAPAAVPGVREIRLMGPGGLTNPLRFEVGAFTEICEREPNDSKQGSTLSPVSGVPAVWNGQVLPGDIDRLSFHARRGQNLVVDVRARALMPYLADAVPGWFQPVLAIIDPKGKELAYADDFRFRPDPVLMFRVPDDGDFTLEIRDSIFRGREDFVYRIQVSEQPFVTSFFPLGASVGSAASVRLAGWNLPRTHVVLDTRSAPGNWREFSVTGRGLHSNPVVYALDELPDALEKEPNDGRERAMDVPWPCVINGCINPVGDTDVFRLLAPARSDVTIAVSARRLGSPLDALIRVSDGSGKVLAWNDDSMPKDGHLQLGDGLLTHHADSRVSLKLPDKGPFFVQIEDAQHHGGEAFGYRMRVAPPQPDFALRVIPSSINLLPGQALPLTLHVDRRDGFSGPVTIDLKGALAGWSLSGNVIPSDREHLRLTLQAPLAAPPGVMALHLTGSAQLGGVTITREVEASDDMMQAFLWRHLVPARECLVAVLAGKGRVPPMRRIDEGVVSIPAGGETIVTFRLPGWVARQGVELVGIEVPDGLALRPEMQEPDGLVLHLTADEAKLMPGYSDNLIFGVVLKPGSLGKDAKKPTKRSTGAAPTIFMPALPFTIQQKVSKP